MYVKQNPLLPPEQEAVVTNCIAVGMALHRALGPGFKEKIYQRAFALELDSRGISLEEEKEIEVVYRSWRIPGQRIDLIVERLVLVELKAVPKLKPLHEAQVRSYLKTTGLRVGLLMNFNAPVLKAGLRRIVM
jgi:GxxExxY protein